MGAILYVITKYNLNLSLFSILELIFLSLLAAIIFYCLFFIFATVSIYISRLTALKPTYDVMAGTMRYPGEVFTRGNRVLEIVLFPFLLVSTFPVKIILGKLPAISSVLLILSLLVIFIFANKFWHFALRRYSSASS